MNAIEERITNILLDEFKIQHGSVGPDTTFAELSFDSLVIVELALVLSNEFGIPLADGELTEAMTVADAAELMTVKGTAP